MPNLSSHRFSHPLAGLGLAAILVVSATGLREADAKPSRVGAMVDAGVPDGVVASLVVRPLEQLKFHGGLGYNLISPGVRAGVTVVPINWWLSPTLSVEAGRYFVGDANKTAAMFESEPEPGTEREDNPILREIGYDFANFHLGLEIGGARFRYYLQFGFSAVRGEIRNLDEALNDDDDDDDMMDEGGPQVEIRSDPLVELWIPSARTGFILFF